MKKLTLFFIVVILLFAGCGEKGRAVELTDFESGFIRTDASGGMNYIEIKPTVDVEGLTVEYDITGYYRSEAVPCGIFKKEVGDVKADRTYWVMIDNLPNGVAYIHEIELISATGTVK